MRTALEMANFYTGWIDLSDPAVRDWAAKKLMADIESVISEGMYGKKVNNQLMKLLNYDQALREADASMRVREEPRRKLSDLFRPIEQVLALDEEVFYALVLSNIVSSSKTDPVLKMKNILKPESENAAVAFTGNRCIIVCRTWSRDPVRIIPYDDITGIQPFVKHEKAFGSGWDRELGITIHLPYDSISFEPCPWIFAKTDYDSYVRWLPWTNYQTDILEIVTRYKQGRAQKQTYAAPHTIPQAQAYAPPQQPQAQTYAPPQQPQAQTYTPPQAAPQQAPAAPQASAIPQEEAIEAMKRFKELLDMGILTQEEFDAKKKQLLGL